MGGWVVDLLEVDGRVLGVHPLLFGWGMEVQRGRGWLRPRRTCQLARGPCSVGSLSGVQV